MHYLTRPSAATLARLALLIALGISLNGCASLVRRVVEIGEQPALAEIENPVEQRGYRPVRLPMPQPEPVTRQANSLWRPGARAFFKDQRATRVGDILTVKVNIEDEASVDNTTSRARDATEDAGITRLLGFETKLAAILPNIPDLSGMVELGSSTATDGAGSVGRSENIDLEVAALVTQILPNGNLVISGRQEVRVNFEVRELMVTGVVRPEDITRTNTILHSQIAEARIAYGGRGQLTDMQQPRWGQQVLDIILPF